MRSMVALAAVFLLFSPRSALAQEVATADENSQPTSWSQPAAAKVSSLHEAREALSLGLLDAVAVGSIKRSYTRNGSVSVREHDLRIITSGEKYSVQLVEKVPAEILGQLDPNEAVVRNETVRRQLATYLILFDGESVYSVEISEQTSRGKGQFGFQQKSALRVAGYPCCPPLHLWSAYALPTASSKLQLQTLGGADLPNGANEHGESNGRLSSDRDSSFVLHEKNAGFNVKYYFFGEFEHDLRRITFFSPASPRPFREVAYEWGQIGDDIYYPSRFSVRDRHVASEPSDTRVDINDLSIEFYDMQLGPEALKDYRFTLSDLPIPVGTRFDDHRENENGKPIEKVWDGTALRRQ